MTFLLELLLTFLLNIICSLAILFILKAALLAGDSLLDWPLGDLTLTLLDISTDGVGDIVALPPGDGVVDGLGHLLTHLLGYLAANRLGSLPNHGRGVVRKRDTSQRKEKEGYKVDLHVESLGCTD